MKKFLPIAAISLFLFSLFTLLLYSYTQIDLGLALSRFAVWHDIQRAFQEIGYFNRPLSSMLYIGIISVLTGSHFLILFLLFKNYISKKTLWLLCLLSAFILFFSYNAFSYDLFNYIFDARIVTEYGDNPYERRALDYPEDPMLGFMRWTHRVYPYGPVWLLLSVPLSYLSMGSLLLNMFVFKGLAVFSYLGSVYVLTKIAEKIHLSHKNFHIGLFALHPLVLIEALVSAHNDIVMVFLALVSLYLLLLKKPWFSVAFYGLSVGIKYATAFLLPVMGYLLYKRGQVTDWQKIITLSFLCMFFAVIAASSRTQFQPWYLLYILPFAALSKRISIVVPTLIVSLFSLLQYLPYIYTGNYDPPIPFVMAGFLSASLIVSALVLIVIYIAGLLRRSSAKS